MLALEPIQLQITMYISLIYMAVLMYETRIKKLCKFLPELAPGMGPGGPPGADPLPVPPQPESKEWEMGSETTPSTGCVLEYDCRLASCMLLDLITFSFLTAHGMSAHAYLAHSSETCEPPDVSLRNAQLGDDRRR